MAVVVTSVVHVVHPSLAIPRLCCFLGGAHHPHETNVHGQLSAHLRSLGPLFRAAIPPAVLHPTVSHLMCASQSCWCVTVDRST